MSDAIQSGDVVQLKSGGPLMTVHSIELFNKAPTANCMWFDKNDHKKGMFAVPMLKKNDGSVEL